MELTEKYFMEMAGWKAMKEARALLESRKVLSATWKDPVLKGLVQAGGRDYACGFIFKSPTDVENLCRCRDSREWGQLCHHSVAVGLEIVRKQDFKAGRLAPKARQNVDLTRSAPRAPEEKPQSSILKRTSEAGENTGQLSISIALAPNWADNLEKGAKVSMTFYGDTGGKLGPLGAVDTRQTYFLEEWDLRLVQALEDLGIDQLPSHLTVDASAFLGLAAELSGHPEVTVVKGSHLKISDRPWIPACTLRAEEDGSLILDLTKSASAQAPRILMGPPPWVLIGNKLRPVSPAASQWDWSKNSHTIPRGRLSQFLNTQWNDLEATGQVESLVDPGQFEIRTGKPAFHLSLEGGLAVLRARLRCQYGVAFYTLSPRSVSKDGNSTDWLADENHPFSYWTRDWKAETEALDLMLRAGFQPSTDPDSMELKGQERVLPFFATVYPHLKKREWKIELESRLDHSLNTKVERIEPGFDFVSSGVDWFEMSMNFTGSGNRQFSEAEVHDLLRSGKPYRKKPDGTFLMINTPMVEEFQEVLRDCSPERQGDKYKLSIEQAPFLVDSIRSNSNWRVNGTPEERVNPSDLVIEYPDNLNSLLRDYQKTGTRWMYALGRNRLGGILADDMGLGKTLQTLTFLKLRKSEAVSSADGGRPSMVICPTSLVFNWESEARKFVPDLKVVAMHGPNRDARFTDIAETDLIITSFALIQRDIEKYDGLELDSVFVDEAQNIKNPKARSAEAIRRLRACNRFALTGTPVENRIMDLWAIMDFVMPGYLGSRQDFQSRYEAPIAKAGDKAVAERLRRRISPFILRRIKSDVVKELPDKIDQIRLCEMTDDQASLYRSILDSSRNRIHDAVKASGFARSQFLIFQTLMRLRQVCCDLRLLGDDERLKKARTAKFELFHELVDEAVDGGHKILVFSQFTSMLGLLKESLTTRDIGYSLLQGNTRNRQKVIDEFRSSQEKQVFLISLKAGGTGLNLTEADVVIHYDPWWNPAVEDQATSRAHRIGQDRVVTNYKLITKGTIEEKILHLQQKKRDLFQAMVDDPSHAAENLSWDEVQDLLDDHT